MPTSRDSRFETLARQFDIDCCQPLQAVNNYQLAVLHDGTLHVSGQLPRNAQGVAVCGSAGEQLRSKRRNMPLASAPYEHSPSCARHLDHSRP